MRPSSLFLSIAGIHLAAVAFLACAGRPGGPGTAETAGRASPPASTLTPFSLEDLDGNPLEWSVETGSLVARGATQRPPALILHLFQTDCPKCEEAALALERLARETPSAAVIGVTYRHGESEARSFVERTGIGYPVAVGAEDAWARRWGRGDPLYVVDSRGRIVYSQTGYRDEDVELWRTAALDLAAGRPVRVARPAREDLQAGDPLPAIELPDLRTGRPLALRTDEQGLVYADAEGRSHRYRGSLGFFSRY